MPLTQVTLPISLFANEIVWVWPTPILPLKTADRGAVFVENSKAPISVPKPNVVPLVFELKSLERLFETEPAIPFPFKYHDCDEEVFGLKSAVK